MTTEEKIQAEIVTYYNNNFCLNHHSPQCIIFAVPNQNQHRLIKIGVLPGVNDLIIIHATKSNPIGRHYYFEVKTPTGLESPSQKKFKARLVKLGIPTFVVRSLEEFLRYIRDINETDKT